MSTDALSPLLYPDAWNKVEIAGRECPGICVVSGFVRNFGWDIKKGKGTKGATLTLNEFPPAEGKIVFSLWTQNHFDEWVEFRKLFLYDPPKTKGGPVDIYHPSLADIEITSVVCKSLSPVQHKGKGLYEITGDFIEYLPPPPVAKVSTADGSKSNTGFKAGGDPGDKDKKVADEQQAQIKKLLEEAKKP